MPQNPTIEDIAAETLKTIVDLIDGLVVANCLPASPERLAGLEFVISSYTTIVLEILADSNHPDKMVFKFPELRSSRARTQAPSADWSGFLVRNEGQHLEGIDNFSLLDVAAVLSMRYQYLVKVEREDLENEMATNDPMMAVSFLQRDFPDFTSHIRLVPDHGLSFVIDGYSYEDLRKILASLTWVRV